MKYVLYLTFVGLLNACSASRYPAAVSARPLTLPEGNNQLSFFGGATLPLNKQKHPVSGYGSVVYRHGITDHLEYQFPLRAAYHWGETEGSQFAVAGGLTGYGTRKRTLPFSGDPREPRETQRYSHLYSELVVSSKLRFSPELSLFGALSGLHGQSFPSDYNEERGAVSFSLSFEITTWLSMAATVYSQLYWRQKDKERYVSLQIGGNGYDGYNPIPMFSFHLTDAFDLTTSPGITYRFHSGKLSASLSVGLDWHW